MRICLVLLAMRLLRYFLRNFDADNLKSSRFEIIELLFFIYSAMKTFK